ncbi:sigma 54-interacting transcriptional regulator [Haliea sp. E1-2-M8]|uniref:sigma 54-interacting transcriptional regulator n=1 Tax=Haliea sp. E1-2-M8 TaxID=3064706 RepID=UPI00271E7671|nr:sigma 54-interacting transcriptional regulator [Haliea sp. E1-2-M8]MDO8860090.1 sigma 54-interacting transcriptional regulator [Haliea sp. E1-2-M8]
MLTTADKLEGYVLDNMEGAVDQAAFLARTETPVAIIGARGTGKMYIARILHTQAGGCADSLVAVDCREFRSRDDANRRIRQALLTGAGKTLVFKSPQLMSADAQLKLARQMATRLLADTDTPTYLPAVRFVALFPETLQALVAQGLLQRKLASAFAAYPIRVPPMRHRQRAVLRWAHKILSQECASRSIVVKGFTPEAEQAMRQHPWHGNISEIRQRVVRALEQKPGGEWLTPVDLKLYLGDRATSGSLEPPLQALAGQEFTSGGYSPSAWEELELALGERVNQLLLAQTPLPLGTWLEDEIVLAALVRYQGRHGPSAEFLQTSRRNIVRWLPVIAKRQSARDGSALWQEPARLVADWVRGLGSAGASPLLAGQELLLELLEAQREVATVELRAQLLGVSRPTYGRRLREWRALTWPAGQAEAHG